MAVASADKLGRDKVDIIIKSIGGLILAMGIVLMIIMMGTLSSGAGDEWMEWLAA